MKKPCVLAMVGRWPACLNLVAVIAGSALAAEVCEMVFTSCPENFNGDTIVVSDDVVAVAAEVLACTPTDVQEGIDTTVIDSGGPPSVMFVIDHSGSMTGTGQQCNDQWGARYTVVKALLDTIFSMHPDAEVGLAVFQEYLYFDTRSSQPYARYFTAMPATYDNNANQAYLPLKQLNQTYNGRTGLSIIQDILATDTLDGARDTACDGTNYLDLTYRPEWDPVGYTNINIGFLAAQEAFKTAQYPTRRQFIVFLSDGIPRGPNQAGLNNFWFQQGTNVPTTFTVFFIPTEGDTAPQALLAMTDNIKTNGYSASNVNSELWTLQASHEALLGLLSEQVLGYIVNWAPVVMKGEPQKMIINNKTPQTQTDSSFIFSQRFPLTGDLTQFTMRIEYEYTNQKTGQKRDSILTVTFHVKRQSGTGVTLTSGVSKECWTQPSLDLLYQGVSLLGDTVHENMQQLVVQLTPNDEQMSSANVSVRSSLEAEGLTLAQSNNVWTKEFLRLVAASSQVDDKKLQHRAADSIVVVWRNPNLPLDTVRIAVPFRVSRSLAVAAAEYHDTDADGYIDSIYVNMGADLFAGDLDQLKQWVTLPGGRGFSNVQYVAAPNGFAILVDESKSGDPRTDVDAKDELKVAGGIFTHGGLVLELSVQVTDRMAPVIVSAVVVTGDTQGDSLKVKFSEPVGPITFSQPFKFKSVDGRLYAVTLVELSHSGKDYFFRVSNVTVVDDQQPGDSVWINPDGQVLDLRGNKQGNPNNRRVRLDVKQSPYNIIPNVAFNPFDFTVGEKALAPAQQAAFTQFVATYTTMASQQNIDITKERGPVVIVEPGPGSKLRQSTVLSGKITVYDVVKNILIRDHDMVFDQDKKRLAYMWNGLNENGKKVATGTYMAVITITDNYGLNETKTVRIGVKR